MSALDKTKPPGSKPPYKTAGNCDERAWRLDIRMKTRESAGPRPRRDRLPRIVRGLVLILLVSCASRDEVRSGASAVYSTVSASPSCPGITGALYDGKAPRADGSSRNPVTTTAPLPTRKIHTSVEGRVGGTRRIERRSRARLGVRINAGAAGSAKRPLAGPFRIAYTWRSIFRKPAPSSFLVGATTLP
jgi:hypothetical protein